MSIRKILMATKPLTRNIHASKPLCEDTRIKSLKEWQTFFQKPDGVPVYLKRGMTDRLLVGFIVIATGCGLANSFKFLYEEIIKPWIFLTCRFTVSFVIIIIIQWDNVIINYVLLFKRYCAFCTSNRYNI